MIPRPKIFPRASQYNNPQGNWEDVFHLFGFPFPGEPPFSAARARALLDR